MPACVIWLDSDHAKLFNITNDGVKKTELKNKHHAHSNGHQDAHKHHEAEHFFHEIAELVGKVDELLVFGPGVAKNHFKTHLEKHHHNELVKHLVGLEALDKLSDNQILDASRKFFKKYNQFHPKVSE